MTKMQKDVFLSEEGDRWFLRNEKDPAPVPFIETLEKYVKPRHKILEIGSAHGRNLEHFRVKMDCESYGVEPSEQAVVKSKELFPKLNIQRGTSDSLPFPDAMFDVVYFGFCLYLVDRSLLMKTFAEADRVLKDKGFLILTDFDSQKKMRVPYSHLEGVFSYRTNYEAILSSFHYALAEKIPFSHSGAGFHPTAYERVAHQVFFKDLEGTYA